ncbi:hypothetical protein C8R45DRAFT_946383 [Mycena sanguinolenta]|nr:hypothetical protein C8R45DRAFT_946383 [Mycena sanguinolenta]
MYTVSATIDVVLPFSTVLCVVHHNDGTAHASCLIVLESFGCVVRGICQRFLSNRSLLPVQSTMVTCTRARPESVQQCTARTASSRIEGGGAGNSLTTDSSRLLHPTAAVRDAQGAPGATVKMRH